MYERLDEQVVPGKRLGRHVNHDPRSLQYRFRAANVPLASVEHTIHIPILDQGDIGSCVANTGTEILAADPFWTTLNSTEEGALNEDYAVALYHDLTVADSYPGTYPPDDTGSDGLTLAKVLTSRKMINGYQHVLDPTSALAALQTVPLAVGMQWLTGCDNPNSDGLVKYTGTVRGGHEITAFKFDADKQWVWFRNHWGDWGKDGCFALTVSDFGKALANQGDATVLVPRTAPAPQPTPPPAPPVDTPWGDLVAAMQPWAQSPHVWSKATKAAKAWNAYPKGV